MVLALTLPVLVWFYSFLPQERAIDQGQYTGERGLGVPTDLLLTNRHLSAIIKYFAFRVTGLPTDSSRQRQRI